MASGSEDEKTLSNTPSWRVEVLILIFIVITLLWEKGTDKIEHFLSTRKRLGLRHVIHKVEEELLALGLISLILIALQDPLSHFCVDKPASEGEKHSSSYSDDKYADDPHSKEEPTDSHARRLAASGGGENCPEGQEPFWSISTTHQTHIFIFLLALIHIVYAMLSMLICLWKVRTWRKWEEMADHNLVDITNKHLLSRSNIFCYYWDAWTASFTESIDRSVYLGLRRLFIERMSLPDSFNFHEFLVNSMEEEFSKVVKMEWLMWVIVGIWILAPPYVLFIMTGFAVISMVIVGTQLELVAIKLSHQAYLSYGDRPSLQQQEGPSLIRRSLATISKGLRKGSKKYETDGEVRREVRVERRPSKTRIHSDDLDLFMARDKRRGFGAISRTGSFSLDHSGKDKDLSTQEITSSGAPSAIVPHKTADLQRGSQVRSGYSSSSDDEYQTDTPLHRGMAKHEAEGSIPDTQDAKPGTSFGNVDYGEKLGAAPVMESQQREKSSIGFRARRFARAVDWVLGGKKHEEQRIQLHQDTFAESYPVADSAQLFWLRRPRLMLRAVQFTYFETSIVLAILLFNMWQDMAFIISKDFGNHNWLTFGLVILGVLLMLHSAYFILPVYALTMAAGSHCPRSILKLAKKKKIKPKMVNALERMSYNPFGQGTTSAEANVPADVLIDMDWEREMEQVAAEEDRNQNSITTLLGAMFQEKAKEYTLARRSYQRQSEDMSSLQPRWMSENSPRSHGKYPMSATEPELVSGEHSRPKSPLRTSSEPPQQASEFKRMPTFAIEQENKQTSSSSMAVGGGAVRRSRSDGVGGDPPQQEEEGVDEIMGTSETVDLGGQLRKSSFSFDSQMSGMAATKRMPSQTILDEPDAYTKKCTIYGSHATLHEIALLFKQAEERRKGEPSRRRGST